MDAQPEWVWDRGDYDELGRRLGELADRLVVSVDRRLGGLDAYRVVDLACGTGNASFAAAARGAEVTGVDLGDGLLALARERATSAGIDVSWLLADATDTGLPGEGFDAALSSVGLIFVPDRATAIAEAARLLSPGGVFGYTAWGYDDDTPFSKPFEAFLPDSNEPGQRPWEWAEPDVINAELAVAFRQIEIEFCDYVWSFDTVDEAVQLVEASPMHVATAQRIPIGNRPALRLAFADAFEALRGPDGRLTYTSPYVVVTARRPG